MESVWEDIFKNGSGPGSVKFTCSDGAIYAPKVLIVRRSDYLAAMLDGYFVESTNQEVKLPNYDVIHVRAILSYLCYGKKPDPGKLANSFHIMELARCWLITELLNHYTQFYCYSVTLETKISAIKYAKRGDFNELEAKLIERIATDIIHHTYKENCMDYFEKSVVSLEPDQKEKIKLYIIKHEVSLRASGYPSGFHYHE